MTMLNPVEDHTSGYGPPLDQTRHRRIARPGRILGKDGPDGTVVVISSSRPLAECGCQTVVASGRSGRVYDDIASPQHMAAPRHTSARIRALDLRFTIGDASSCSDTSTAIGTTNG
ncbi:MAG: hypothetical protein R2856_08830 [Caldilineaceae bacterium]